MIVAAVLLILLMLLFGAPLFSVILAAAMLGFWTSGVDLVVIAAELYRLSETPLLVALPLFTVAGYILAESKTSARLVRLTRCFFGWMPAGLAMVALIVCSLFTAFTGASGITIVALGALLLPALREDGYPEKFSLGLVTTSGSLGLLLPPSVPLILYGIIVQQMNVTPKFTLTELFLAGLIPCMFMTLLLALWAIVTTGKIIRPAASFDLLEAWAALKDAAWELPLPVFVVLGIFSGILAVSEIAAVTALYVLLIEVFVYREIRVQKLVDIISQSMQMSGGILLILGVSLAFTNFLVDAQIPVFLFNWVKSSVDSPVMFLVLLNVFLLLLGAILDIFSALVIVVPLIVPVALSYGVHPVHLGIIFLANMQIGYLTPPVGMNLFIASYRFNKPLTELYQATIPYMLILLIAVILITYIPWLSLCLIE